MAAAFIIGGIAIGVARFVLAITFAPIEVRPAVAARIRTQDEHHERPVATIPLRWACGQIADP
jgi:hypothetical protein